MKRFALVYLFALIPALLPTMSQAIEEPEFSVVKKMGAVEIRQYAPYVVAEVTVNASADDAGNQAFPILAGYIFGKNKGEKKMSMTAPVIQSSAPVIQSSAPVTQTTAPPVKMEMTAPVTQAAVPGGYLVQFVLPKTVSLANAPEPLDARVKLREMPAANWAVITYSGTWSQRNFDENLSALRAALKTADIATQGEPVLSRYNGPFTPWFMRRNEIWLAVR
jgi:SOUL heme-binding protein